MEQIIGEKFLASLLSMVGRKLCPLLYGRPACLRDRKARDRQGIRSEDSVAGAHFLLSAIRTFRKSSRSGAQRCAFPQHGRRRAHQVGRIACRYNPPLRPVSAPQCGPRAGDDARGAGVSGFLVRVDIAEKRAAWQEFNSILILCQSFAASDPLYPAPYFCHS